MKNLILIIALITSIGSYTQDFNAQSQNNFQVTKSVSLLNICDLKTIPDSECTWKVTENDEVFSASITIEKDNLISIYYGSPITIYVDLIEKGNDEFDVFFSFFDATLSMNKIIKELEGEIDFKESIGLLKVINPEELELTWFGFKLTNYSYRWLSKLEDEVFWGNNPANQNTNRVFLTKVK